MELTALSEDKPIESSPDALKEELESQDSTSEVLESLEDSPDKVNNALTTTIQDNNNTSLDACGPEPGEVLESSEDTEAEPTLASSGKEVTLRETSAGTQFLEPSRDSEEEEETASPDNKETEPGINALVEEFLYQEETQESEEP